MAWFPLMIQIELWKEACEANQLSALLSVFFLQIHNWFTASLSEKALFTFVTNWDQAIFPLVLSFWCVAPESRIMYNIDIENDKHVRRYPRYCLLHFVKNRRFCSQQTKQEYTKEHKGTYLQIYIYKLITNILSYLPGPITIISIAAKVPIQAPIGVVLRNSSLPSLDVKSDNFLMLRVRIY